MADPSASESNKQNQGDDRDLRNVDLNSLELMNSRSVGGKAIALSALLQVKLNDELEVLEISEGIEDDQWAQNEFGGAQLDDERLSKRLVDSARIQAEKPGEAFSGAAQGNWPLVTGNCSSVTAPALLYYLRPCRHALLLVPLSM